jgi:chemotaxis protein MotB
MNNDDRPIIVVKKKAGHGGHHGGSWKVAYADFVTAMMAFFLVMWILGLNQDTRKAIAAYFNDPMGMMRSHAGGSNPIGLGRESSAQPSIMKSLPALMKEEKEAEGQRFKVAKEALEAKIGGLPEFKAFKQYIDINITTEGLRVELLDGVQSLFFETGSAVMKKRTEDLLRMIAKELKALPNPIILEGHTDAQPFASGNTGYSNWELSSDRANAARRIMAPILAHNQIVEVRGYADRRLRNPENPMHFSNRRISIMVQYSERTTSAPAREVGPDNVRGMLSPPPPNIRPPSGEEGMPQPAPKPKHH